jgi:cysteinyl-tRNA synthetase
MHNGMLRLTGEKMSKSLGNIATLQEVLDEWGRETLLLFFLTAHWRKPIDFSEETMAQAKAQLRHFENTIHWHLGESRPSLEWSAFEEALDDDFNTPRALSILHEWADAWQVALLRRGLGVFGIEAIKSEPHEMLVQMAEQRQAARQRRDYQEADRLREELGRHGWDVRDIPTDPGFQLVPRL